MSKTKEQCLNIISKQFSNIEEKQSIDKRISILEESIKEIVESEYAYVWQYDSPNNRIIHKDKVFLLADSILKLTSMSKKVFFDNHISSHKNYNKIIDNPLNIKLKSMIVLPIFQQEKLIGFLVAYNSFSYGSDFQRYDTRSIGLLTKCSEKLLIESLSEKKIINHKKVKKEISMSKSKLDKTPLKRIMKKSRKELEEELKKQAEKIQALEIRLAKEREVKHELVVVEEAMDVLVEEDKYQELKSIIDFLNNELSYFAESQNVIYTFLEIIKNSLHDKAQLELIENKLNSSQLVHHFVDTLQNREQMPLNIEAFKTYQGLLSVVNLYVKVFAQEELLFNIFLDPKMPSELLGDIEKIESLMVHLFNNINCLTTQQGRVEFSVLYNVEEALLELIVKGLPPLETKSLFNFFKKKKVSNSLTTNNSGLGLSVVSNLVKVLNGKLKLTTKENGEHEFMVSIPCSLPNSSNNLNKTFKAKKPLKIAILMSYDDEYAFYNLRRYLEAFAISNENIVVFNNYKKLEGKNFSHLFCFEDMLSDKIDVSKIPSITVLRYSGIVLDYEESVSVNELYLNAYYGMSLQEILFPNIRTEEIESNTILLEYNHVKKEKEKKSKELNSYVGQLRGFKS